MFNSFSTFASPKMKVSYFSVCKKIVWIFYLYMCNTNGVSLSCPDYNTCKCRVTIFCLKSLIPLITHFLCLTLFTDLFLMKEEKLLKGINGFQQKFKFSCVVRGQNPYTDGYWKRELYSVHFFSLQKQVQGLFYETYIRPCFQTKGFLSKRFIRR